MKTDLCVDLVSGRTESGHLDRRASDDNHARWIHSCHKSRSCSARRPNKHLGRRAPGRTSSGLWVSAQSMCFVVRIEPIVVGMVWFLLLWVIVTLLFDFYHSFDPNPMKRHTFWTIVIGGTFTWMSVYSINQSQVQRFISCKTLGHAKMWVFLHLNANPHTHQHTEEPYVIYQVFVPEHDWLAGDGESGCVFRPHHVLHLQELRPTNKWWRWHLWSGERCCSVCDFFFNSLGTSTSSYVLKQCCVFPSYFLTLWWIFWQIIPESPACLWLLHIAAPWGEACARFFFFDILIPIDSRLRWIKWITCITLHLVQAELCLVI